MGKHGNSVRWTPARKRKRLDYARAAKYLGISKGTLRNWISSGDYAVPHIRVGDLVRFEPEQLDAWLVARGRNRLAVPPNPAGMSAEA